MIIDNYPFIITQLSMLIIKLNAKKHMTVLCIFGSFRKTRKLSFPIGHNQLWMIWWYYLLRKLHLTLCAVDIPMKRLVPWCFSVLGTSKKFLRCENHLKTISKPSKTI